MLTTIDKYHIDINIIPQKWLDEISEQILINLKNNTSKDELYKSGSIRLSEVSTEMNTKLLFYKFVNEIEDILCNIDVIFSDLNNMKINPYYFHDVPYKRFYLLLRTFFYEFYRIKEKHKTFLRGLEKAKHIDTSQVKIFNKIFFTLFKDTLSLRNDLVHNSVIWIEGHIELTLLFAAEKTNHRLLKVDTKEELSWDKLLPVIIENYCVIFQEQSTKVLEYIESLLEELIKIVALKTDKQINQPGTIS